MTDVRRNDITADRDIHAASVAATRLQNNTF